MQPLLRKGPQLSVLLKIRPWINR
eukprot:SAG31_NODE_34946_length_327_cov_1.622807_1_plen_23_part_10